MSDSTCIVCGDPLPDEYEKYDRDAPVYADDYAFHRRCQDAIFADVYETV